MRWLRSIANEIYGLFVDDGRFALGLLIWAVAGSVALRFLGVAHAAGPILFVGFAGLLVYNTLRSARRH